MEIFLRIDGENAGPLTIYEVREMLRSGKATPETKCWAKGLESWVPLSEFPPLEGDAVLRVAAAGGDEIAVSDEEREAAIHAALHPERPRPWVRFWARTLDFTLFTAVVVAMVGLTGSSDPARFVYPLQTNLPELLSVPFAWLFVEAVVLHYFKTTPGKWLLNVRLSREDGEPLTLGQTLRRSFSVWWRGIGFGIVPLTIVCCALSNLSLATRGKTPWDIRDDLRVDHEPVPLIRVVAYAFLTLLATSVVVHFAGPPPMPQPQQ